MRKKLKGGKICVIYSPSHGAGWYSWHGIRELLFDPMLVEMIERKAGIEEMEGYLNTAYSEQFQGHHIGDLEDLEVAYVDTDDRFYIHEYDGAERVVLESTFEWISAT